MSGERLIYSHLELVTDALSVLGESPVWDDRSRCLYYVDLNGKRLRRLDVSSGAVSDTVLPEQAGCVVLGQSGEIILGMQSGVYMLTGGTPEKLNKPFKMEGIRFNDGKAGPDGRLYIGTISKNFSGAFYLMETDGEMVKLLSGVGNSNGLDWDLERNRFYYNDTYKGTTDVLEIVRDGKIPIKLSSRRNFFTYSHGAPDGMTIDSAGNLWTAVWGGEKVVCISPEGRLTGEYSVPANNVTCCAFGGDDYKTLYITTADRGGDFRRFPLSGAVWSMRTEIPGKPVFRLKINKLH